MSAQTILPAAPAAVPVAADRAEVLEYLRALWPEGPGRLYLCVWHPPGTSRWFGGASTEAASLAALERAADHIAANPTNAYVGMCLAGADHGPHQRLSRKEGRLAHAAPGLWLDVDLQGPGHKSANLPESVEQVIDTLHAAGLARFVPTAAVHSGGGYHLYWLFKEPLTFEAGSDPRFHERDQFASILRRFQRLIRDAAAAKGMAVDATSDVERILRPAGTIRVKEGCAPVQTRFYVELSSGVRYNASEIEDLLDTLGVVDRHEHQEDAPTRVGSIIVDPRATVDPEQFRMLIEADPTGLSPIWNLRKHLGTAIAPEDSFSERDMQMAGYLAYWADFDAQRITDWLVYFRRQKAKPGHQRAKHLGYYETTVGKAIDFAKSEREKEERRQTAAAKKEAEAAEAARIEQQQKQARASQDGARAVLRDVLKVDIEKMLVIKDNGKTTYELAVEGRRVTIGGAAAVFSPELTSRELYGAIGRALPLIKRKVWHDIVLPALHQLREDINLDADHGKLYRWLHYWLCETVDGRVAKNDDEWRLALAAMTDASTTIEHRPGGLIQVYGEVPQCIVRAHRLAQDVARYGDRQEAASIPARLRAAGFLRPKESVTITVGAERFKLRDVFVGDAKWWREFSGGGDGADAAQYTPI